MKTMPVLFLLLSLFLVASINAEDEVEQTEDMAIGARLYGMPKMKISKSFGGNPFSPYGSPMGFGLSPFGMPGMPGMSGYPFSSPFSSPWNPMPFAPSPFGLPTPFAPSPFGPPSPFGFGGLPYGGYGSKLVHKTVMPGYTPTFLNNLPKDDDAKKN